MPYKIYISFLILIGLSYFLQTHIFIDGDVGYLVHISQLMLNGGTYVTDFLETNPPMILYLYMVVVLFAKFTTLSIVTSIHMCVIGISSVSFLLSFWLLTKMIKNRALLYVMSYTLIFVLFFLPAYQFAQREHLLVIFILPYLFSTACQLSNHRVQPGMRFFVSFLAALGFAIKPYFLTTLILVEGYVLWEKKRLKDCLKIETLTIISVMLIYLGMIFLLQPNYIHIILPLISRVYFIGIQEPWKNIFLYPIFVYCIFSLIAYFFICRSFYYRYLGDILMLSCLGFSLSFLMTRAPWFYHVMPAFSFACLLVAFYVGEMTGKVESNNTSISAKNNYVFVITSSLVLLSIPLLNFFLMIHADIEYKTQGSTNKLITYINQKAPHASIYSTSPHVSFPIIHYTQASYGSRFPFFWWIQSILKLSGYPEKNNLLPEAAKKDSDFLITSFAEDLEKFKTDFIIVNKNENSRIFGKNFNFLLYFSGNKNFKQAWSHYHYITSIDYFDIYKRNEKGPA